MTGLPQAMFLALGEAQPQNYTHEEYLKDVVCARLPDALSEPQFPYLRLKSGNRPSGNHLCPSPHSKGRHTQASFRSRPGAGITCEEEKGRHRVHKVTNGTQQGLNKYTQLSSSPDLLALSY